MNAPDVILRLAAELTEVEVDRLASACGFPKPYSLRLRPGSAKEIRVNPYRRYYCTSQPVDNPEWARIYAAGLVGVEPGRSPERVVWLVTDLGVEVIRARLLAEVAAHRRGAR